MVAGVPAAGAADAQLAAIGHVWDAYEAQHQWAGRASPAFVSASRDTLEQAIGAAIAEGKAGSLSEGMQRLADAGRAATMDIGSAWWLDVDDPRAHALAEEQCARSGVDFERVAFDES